VKSSGRTGKVAPVHRLLRTPFVAAVAVAATCFVTTAPAAGAPTATLDGACYAHLPGGGSQPIEATIAGGTPGGNFVLTARGAGRVVGSVSGTFDAAGNAVARLENVTPPSGSTTPRKGEKIDLSVQDFGAGGAETLVASTLLTTIAMEVGARPVNPRRARSVRVSGGPVFARKVLFGFVVREGSTKVLRRFRVGTANVCGYASTRAIVAPRANRVGSYRLYINAGKRLRPSQGLGYKFRLRRLP
jgi:hypothetical protein